MGTSLPGQRFETTPSRTSGLTGTARGVGAVAVVIYGVVIWFSAVRADGQRVWVLLDDAMISMTFARTFAEGHGLVWFPGADPVEGYTNFAWVLWMAGAHLLGLPARLTSLVVMVTSVALLLTGAVLAWRLALRLVDDRRVAMTAFVLVLACYPLVFWSLLGTEVGLLAVLALGACLLADRIAESPSRRDMLLLCGTLTLGVLTRTDFVVVVGGVVLWLAWRAGLRATIAPTVAIAGTLAGHTAFRLAYYGDPLPNTYYLKATGLDLPDRIADGAIALLVLLPNLAVTLALAGAVLAVVRRRDLGLLLGGVFALQVAYSVFVGGDVWEGYGFANRYITVALPALLVLAAGAVPTIIARLRMVPAMAMATLAVLVSATLATPGHSPWIRPDPMHMSLVQYAADLERAAPPGTLVTVTSAGTIPYFTRLPAVDLLGKVDRDIAHGPVHPAGHDGLPGHNKWDYQHSIGKLQPDVVPRLWMAPEEACANFDRWGYERSGAGFVRDGVDVVVPTHPQMPHMCPDIDPG